VQSGQADAGLVYHSDAVNASGCRILFTAAAAAAAVHYAAALTRQGERSPAARDLLAFLTADEAAPRFRQTGFLPAEGVMSE
jgi:ABC-type molybdate transport system substrate-binding protein